MRTAVFWTLALLILANWTPSRAADPAAAVRETIAGGHVDWSQGVVYVSGTGIPAEKETGTSLARSKVVMAAKVDASQNLGEIVRQISIRSGTTVAEAAESDSAVKAELERMVRQSAVDGQDFLSDGTVRVTLRFDLRGAFSQLLLPAEIKQVEAVKPVHPTTNETASPAAGGQGERQPEPVFTGLVVDARGLKVRPALFPAVYDESGSEVYGSAFVSREYAVQQGMSGYLKDLETARKDARVRDNPLTVRGLRTHGADLSSVVISKADAGKLRSTSEHLTFLKECRVLIVLD